MSLTCRRLGAWELSLLAPIIKLSESSPPPPLLATLSAPAACRHSGRVNGILYYRQWLLTHGNTQEDVVLTEIMEYQVLSFFG